MTTSIRMHEIWSRAAAGVVAATLAGFAPHASGQIVANADWHRGTTLAGFVGAASSQSVTDAAAGVTVGWEFTPRLAIEGRGLGLDAGPGADAFTALLGARVPILPGRLIGPFVNGGVGLYRATSGGGSFDDFDLGVGTGADIALGVRVRRAGALGTREHRPAYGSNPNGIVPPELAEAGARQHDRSGLGDAMVVQFREPCRARLS